MFSNPVNAVIQLAIMAMIGVLAGTIAANKRRSEVAWGIASAVFVVPLFLLLALNPLCPTCRQPLRAKDDTEGAELACHYCEARATAMMAAQAAAAAAEQEGQGDDDDGQGGAGGVSAIPLGGASAAGNPLGAAFGASPAMLMARHEPTPMPAPPNFEVARSVIAEVVEDMDEVDLQFIVPDMCLRRDVGMSEAELSAFFTALETRLGVVLEAEARTRAADDEWSLRDVLDSLVGPPTSPTA